MNKPLGMSLLLSVAVSACGPQLGEADSGQTLKVQRAAETTTCKTVNLSDYNLFVLGSYRNGHDVQGKVAAGGDISLANFSVGGSLAQNDTSNVLVAGGNLQANNGTIYGNAFYGGSTTAGQNVTLQRGTLSQGTPIDFSQRGAQLRDLSAHLASDPNPNGTTRVEPWGGLYLTGTSQGVNTFSVDGGLFANLHYLSISAPANSRVVINVTGASARFANFGQSFSGGIDQHGVIYNFVSATSIEASSYGFWGTILAPYADVSFNNGSWDGGIYARSLTGTAEGHINPLTNFDYCVTQPGGGNENPGGGGGGGGGGGWGGGGLPT